MSTPTSLEITESVTDVVVTGDDISVNLTDDVTTVQVYTLAVPVATGSAAEDIVVTPYNTVTATNLADALKQLADQNFRGTSLDVSGSVIDGTSTVSEGDTWYDTDDNQFKIYREVSSNVYSWVPLVIGTDDSDTLDGGSY